MTNLNLIDACIATELVGLTNVGTSSNGSALYVDRQKRIRVEIMVFFWIWRSNCTYVATAGSEYIIAYINVETRSTANAFGRSFSSLQTVASACKLQGRKGHGLTIHSRQASQYLCDNVKDPEGSLSILVRRPFMNSFDWNVNQHLMGDVSRESGTTSPPPPSPARISTPSPIASAELEEQPALSIFGDTTPDTTGRRRSLLPILKKTNKHWSLMTSH